jgi:RNA-directed DNA polymerase
LDADSEKCCDRIDQETLLAQGNPRPSLRRQLRAWRKAGVFDQGTLFPTEAGTRPGSPVSPLRAHSALHGVETAITQAFPRSGSRNRPPPNVGVSADDLVILHKDHAIVERCQQLAAAWLRPMGLALQPSKTRSTHTRETPDDKAGCDFLGLHIRQHPVGKTKSGRNGRGRLHGCKTLITPRHTARRRQRTPVHQTIARHQHAEQRTLSAALTLRIQGWSNYYRQVTSARVFCTVDHTLDTQRRGWAIHRHPHKSKHWIIGKYWRVDEGKGWCFQPPAGGRALTRHAKTAIRYHGKVQGTRSPYDGDGVYWRTR